MNWLVAICFMATGWLLFQQAISTRECSVRRAKMALLAIAFLCLGVGRAFWEIGVFKQWMLVSGDIAIIAFGLFYVAVRWWHGKFGGLDR